MLLLNHLHHAAHRTIEDQKEFSVSLLQRPTEFYVHVAGETSAGEKGEPDEPVKDIKGNLETAPERGSITYSILRLDVVEGQDDDDERDEDLHEVEDHLEVHQFLLRLQLHELLLLFKHFPDSL